MTFPHNVNNADIFYNIICIILPSFCRAMMDSHYITGTCKQHASSEHLGQDAASGPHVDGLGVVLGGQEETGGAVPLGHQTLGQIALSGVKVRVRPKRKRKTQQRSKSSESWAYSTNIGKHVDSCRQTWKSACTITRRAGRMFYQSYRKDFIISHLHGKRSSIAPLMLRLCTDTSSLASVTATTGSRLLPASVNVWLRSGTTGSLRGEEAWADVFCKQPRFSH